MNKLQKNGVILVLVVVIVLVVLNAVFFLDKLIPKQIQVPPKIIEPAIKDCLIRIETYVDKEKVETWQPIGVKCSQVEDCEKAIKDAGATDWELIWDDVKCE